MFDGRLMTLAVCTFSQLVTVLRLARSLALVASY